MARKRSSLLQEKAGSRKEYPIETVMRIIKEAKRRPLSREVGEAVDAELMAYMARSARKTPGIKERYIVRIVHESRAHHGERHCTFCRAT